jgi:hypothetical protein
MKAILKPWIEREQVLHEQQQQKEVEEALWEAEPGQQVGFGFGTDYRRQDPDYFKFFPAVFQMADAELPAVLEKAKLFAEACVVVKLYEMTEEDLDEFLPRARSIIADMAKRGLSAHIS